MIDGEYTLGLIVQPWSRPEGCGFELVPSTQREECSPLFIYNRIKDANTQTFVAELWDPLTRVLLASISCAALNLRSKNVCLHEPDGNVILEFSGSFTGVECTWDWGDITFRWERPGLNRKMVCIIKRGRYDPNVTIAEFSPDSGVRIFDYALQRFEIADRSGLQLVLLIAMLILIDMYESRLPLITSVKSSASPSASPGIPQTASPATSSLKAAENELFISPTLVESNAVEQLIGLLDQTSIIFVVLRQDGDAAAVLRVGAAVKEATIRQKLKLYQYLTEENGLVAMYLSKEELPELQAKVKSSVSLNRRKTSISPEASPSTTLTVGKISPVPEERLGKRLLSVFRSPPG